MIDAQSEQTFPLSQSPKHAEPVIGRRLATSTFYRWAKYGVRGVRLETRFLGGTRYTSTEALQRFFDKLTEDANGAADPPTASEMSRAHQRETEQAIRELAADKI